MLSNDYKHLKRRDETLEEHIEDLRNDIKFYIELYKTQMQELINYKRC